MPLPTLPKLPSLNWHETSDSIFDEGGRSFIGGSPIGGGGFGGFGGGDLFGNPIPGTISIGGSNGGGGFTIGGTVGKVTGSVASAATGAISSALGIPAINWGRIAAFLLGLLLIAGGLYLIKPVNQAVKVTIKEGTKAAKEAAIAASA